ncbi:hypothetical protein J2S17_005429 [Cytobacillus purgationiresistens]|uniref:DUF3854 domain-containing protein n=2 Tax=Cytobacillus purgationiresistens TaxID=863449 RepID=A0ABU0AQH3_9BACI|nr:hypothetical protein [Cytobacillus purgationiresistens]
MKDWFEYYREVCPICQNTGGCLINGKGDTVVCIRVNSEVQFSKRFPSWIHKLNNKRAIKPSEDATYGDFISGQKKLDPNELDSIYSSLLEILSLTDNHYSHLSGPKREMSDIEIECRGYKSFPVRPWEKARKLKALLKVDSFSGTPGFYENKFGWSLAGREGILIPYRNEFNKVIGFQIRIDNPPNDLKIDPGSISGLQARVKEQPNLVQILVDGEIIDEKRLELKKTQLVHHENKTGTLTLVKGKRYFWLSSANKENGTGAGDPMPIHVAIPTHKLKNWNKGEILKTNAVWITEGALKADIAVEHIHRVYSNNELKDLGDTIIATAGVNVWRTALPVLENMGVKNVNLAFDMDAMQNPKVAYFIKEMAVELHKQNYHVNLVLWNIKDGKGIDDIFIQRKSPKIKPLIN